MENKTNDSGRHTLFRVMDLLGTYAFIFLFPATYHR
jgi:hypothetical protein